MSRIYESRILCHVSAISWGLYKEAKQLAHEISKVTTFIYQTRLQNSLASLT